VRGQHFFCWGFISGEEREETASILFSHLIEAKVISKNSIYWKVVFGHSGTYERIIR
jgi:hypothetical protein